MVFPAPCIFFILCAELCVPGQSSYKSIFMVYTERSVGVSCSMYDMLHTGAKGCIMCKLIKLAFCLCCRPISYNAIYTVSLHIVYIALILIVLAK